MYVVPKSLIEDIPQYSFEAIALARRLLLENTEEPSPKFESFANLIASSSVLYFMMLKIGPKI